MSKTLELFPIEDFTNPNHPVTGLTHRKSKFQNKQEYEQIVRDLVAQWEGMGLDPNDVLLEMKLGEIKQILNYCTKQQRDNFGLRLTEWIWFNDDVTEI